MKNKTYSLNRSALKEIELKLQSVYDKLGIDNGYISCTKLRDEYRTFTLIIVVHFYTYDDLCNYDGNEMTCSGEIKSFVKNYEIEDTLQNLEAFISHFVKDEFYHTMNELYSI